jgi:hypothetical protein
MLSIASDISRLFEARLAKRSTPVIQRFYFYMGNGQVSFLPAPQPKLVHEVIGELRSFRRIGQEIIAACF